MKLLAENMIRHFIGLISLLIIFYFQLCIIPLSASPIIFEKSHHTCISKTCTYDEIEGTDLRKVDRTSGLSRVLSIKGVRSDYEVLVRASSVSAKSRTQGFRPFSAFKRAIGPAGLGITCHLNVDQTTGNVANFGTKTIPTHIHPAIYDFHARQFDSGSGRFTSIDQADQFASGYLGMANNPVSAIDPDGNRSIPILGYNGLTRRQTAQVVKDVYYGVSKAPAWLGGSNVYHNSPTHGVNAWYTDGAGTTYTANLSGSLGGGWNLKTHTYSGSSSDAHLLANRPTHSDTNMADYLPVIGSIKRASQAAYYGDNTAMALNMAFGGLETFGLGSMLSTAARSSLMSSAARGSSRAFWSGAGSEASALSKGYQTLGQTRAGQNLAKLTADMPYYPGSQAYNMWARLSTTYAKGAKGTVHVFQNAQQGVGMQSIWRLYEYPALKANPNVTNIIFHY